MKRQLPGNPALDCGKQNAHIQNRFSNVVIESGGEVFLPVSDHCMCRERNYKQVMQIRVVSNAAKNLGSIHLRKRDVENYGVGLMLLKSLYHFNSTKIFNNFVLVFEDRTNDEPIVGIVVDHRNFAHV